MKCIDRVIHDLSQKPSTKPSSVARQLNQCSRSKSKKQFRNINRPWGMTVSKWKRPSQRDVSSDVFVFFKVATEMADRTESVRLFPRYGAQE